METQIERRQALGEKQQRSMLRRRVVTIGGFVGVIWLVWFLDATVFGGRLAQHGVVPRTWEGVLGILWMPFLHVSWSHVVSNTIGMVMLGGILILRSEGAFWGVSIVGAICAGTGTWLIGRAAAVHVGASGVIFAYFGYLLFAGIFERRLGAMLMSVVVFFLWGGMLWGVAPWQAAGISWEGHLCGLGGGILAAWGMAAANRDAVADRRE